MNDFEGTNLHRYQEWTKRADNLLHEMEATFLGVLAEHKAERDASPKAVRNPAQIPAGTVSKELGEGGSKATDTAADRAALLIPFNRYIALKYMGAWTQMLEGSSEAEMYLLDMASAIVHTMAEEAARKGWLTNLEDEGSPDV